MSKLSLWRTMCLICVFYALEAIGAPAQTFKSLVSFRGTDGKFPMGSLVQGFDGNIYGTTFYFGAHGFGGTVFEITPAGHETVLYSFCAQANCTDGAAANSVIQATNGELYGTTAFGGVPISSCHAASGCGTIFKITPAGKLTTLYSFCSQTPCTDGSHPSGLIQGIDGSFYGITGGEGDLNCNGGFGCGTVFKIAAGGKLTTLHSFAGPDGSDPFGLIQATNGDFYGTTAYGAANRTCGRPGCGTIFKITPAGKLTTLYSFCSQTGCTDGSHPSGLIQGVDGNFYGETGSGGIQNYGTLFKITPAGKLTTLHRFSFKDGASPFGLTQATGTILGTLPKP